MKINFGCRAGVCGADPVAICEGHDNLAPAGEDELATLRRLGLEGRARLACMCTVKGPVLIDRDAHSAPPPKVASLLLAPRVDKALQAQLQRVVVVGNGVAGMGVAPVGDGIGGAGGTAGLVAWRDRNRGRHLRADAVEPVPDRRRFTPVHP